MRRVVTGDWRWVTSGVAIPASVQPTATLNHNHHPSLSYPPSTDIGRHAQLAQPPAPTHHHHHPSRHPQTLVDTRSQLKRRLDRAMARLEQMRRSIQDEGERATTRLVTQTQLLGERQKTQSDLEGREGALTQAVEARIQARVV